MTYFPQDGRRSLFDPTFEEQEPVQSKPTVLLTTPKLEPRVETPQQPSAAQVGMENAKKAFYLAASNYDATPTELYNLAGMSRRDLKTLALVGGGVEGPDGKLLTIAPGSNWRDVRRMQRDSERMQSLKRFLVGNGNPAVPGTTPATTLTTPAATANKTYNWDINFDKDGDFSWDNISTKLLQAMYTNGKYDILDQLLDHGKITDNGLSALYKTVLGQTGDKVRFDQSALLAALDGKYITQDLFNELSALLPKVAEEAAPALEAPATTPAPLQTTPLPKSDEYWLAEAKKAGFNSLDEVKQWQQQNGLVADGKFGELSKAKKAALEHAQNTLATQEAPWYSNIQNYYNNYHNAYNFKLNRLNKPSVYTYSNGSTLALLFNNRNLRLFDNGRVLNLKNNKMGSYTVNPDYSINFENIRWDKKGGKLMKYFQAGGAMNPQEDQRTFLKNAFATAAQSDLENLSKMFGIQTPEQLNQFMQIASKVSKQKDADPEMALLASQAIIGILKAVQMQQMAKASKGTKLEYIQRLRGVCPEGYEMKMFKVGGKVCKKCQKIDEACKGKKMENGGESPIVQQFKNGRKCKK